MSGLRIKVYRNSNRLSQKDLGNIMGVSARTVARWELNQVNPNKDELAKLSSLIGCSAEEILNSTDDFVEIPTKDTSQELLEKITEGVDNLVSGQESINETLAVTRVESNKKHDELINDLKEQIKLLIEKQDNQSHIFDIQKAEMHHKRIRTAVIIVTCVIVLVLAFGTWLYWMNHGFDGEVIAGRPSYYELED